MAKEYICPGCETEWDDPVTCPNCGFISCKTCGEEVMLTADYERDKAINMRDDELEERRNSNGQG